MRLELLEREKNEDSVRTLYGLLIILPQSEAFSTLHRRLSAIPPTNSLTHHLNKDKDNINKTKNNDIDFKKLLKHFEQVQDKHKEQKYRQRLNILVERDLFANQFNDNNL